MTLSNLKMKIVLFTHFLRGYYMSFYEVIGYPTGSPSDRLLSKPSARQIWLANILDILAMILAIIPFSDLNKTIHY